MNKIRFSIDINASKIEVWNAIVIDVLYRQWTRVFAEGSHFVGEWRKGATMRFLGADADGNLGGMLSVIADLQPFDYISINHIGFVKDGIEDTESDAVKLWAGAHENYRLNPIDGGTQFEIDMDTTPEYEAYFKEMWPKALAQLKAVAEGKLAPWVTVHARINAPLARVWDAFTDPAQITQWYFASPDWEAPTAENDLRVGGQFKTHMRAKGQQSGFDFEGTYTAVQPHHFIAYTLGDQRAVFVQFVTLPDGVEVVQTFTPEITHPIDMQRAGWQAILDQFKGYVSATMGH